MYICASLPLACERLGSHLPVSPACADTYLPAREGQSHVTISSRVGDSELDVCPL